MTRVLICDDNTGRIPRWIAEVKRHVPGAEVRSLSGSELAALFSELTAIEQQVRRNAWDEQIPAGSPGDAAAHADIVLLDSDLSPSPTDLDLITDRDERDRVALTLRHGFGDELARLLRSYTPAGLTVVINKFPVRSGRGGSFDMTLMREAATAADVHASEGELVDPGLWSTSMPNHHFRPWYRSAILDSLALIASSESAIREQLDRPVLHITGLDPLRLATGQLDAFGIDDPDTATVRDFAGSNLGSKYSLESHESALVRMAASAIRRWLTRFVLPSQNVLLDLPHMLERYGAQLFGDDLEAARAISATTGWDDASRMPGAAALHTCVRPFSYRPIYDAEEIRRLVRSMPAPTRPAADAVVFAEDVSEFVQIDDADSFPSDVPGTQQRRWIAHLAEVDYTPSNRLHL